MGIRRLFSLRKPYFHQNAVENAMENQQSIWRQLAISRSASCGTVCTCKIARRLNTDKVKGIKIAKKVEIDSQVLFDLFPGNDMFELLCNLFEN